VADQRQGQQFDMEMDINQLKLAAGRAEAFDNILRKVRPGDDASLQQAKSEFVNTFGGDPNAIAGVTMDRVMELRAESDLKLKELRARIAATDRSNRPQAGGGGGAPGRPMGRPMSSGVQTREDEDIADIQSVQSINTQIDQILTKLDPKKGDLALGPINNLISQGQNLAGLSTPGSRDFAVLEATLEKMRNDSLRLNKGVQTEGDAIRAWNEITKYMTDPAVVTQQLKRVSELNAVAAQQRLQRINIRRSRNGYDPFNPAEIGYGGGVQTQAAPPPPPQTGGVEPGTIEDGYVFKGGDPADPNNWVEMQ